MSSRGKKAKGKGKGKARAKVAVPKAPRAAKVILTPEQRAQKARDAALARPRANGKFVVSGERKTKAKAPLPKRDIEDGVFFSAANIRRMLQDFNESDSYRRSEKGKLRISRDALILLQKMASVESIGHAFIIAASRASDNKGATVSSNDVFTVRELLNSKYS